MKLCFRKRAIKMLLGNERPDNCTGIVNIQGDTSGSSKLIVQTLPVWGGRKRGEFCKGGCESKTG